MSLPFCYFCQPPQKSLWNVQTPLCWLIKCCMKNGLLFLQVISQINGDNTDILNLNFQVTLHISQIFLKVSNRTLNLHWAKDTSYSCVCGLVWEVNSSAAEDSPQNWILTLWLPLAAGFRVLYAPTRIHIIPNTISSSMPGGKTPMFLN